MLNDYQAIEAKPQRSEKSENTFNLDSEGTQFWQELLITLSREWENKINSEN